MTLSYGGLEYPEFLLNPQMGGREVKSQGK